MASTAQGLAGGGLPHRSQVDETPEALGELGDGETCRGKAPGVWPGSRGSAGQSCHRVGPPPGLGSAGDRGYPGGGRMCALERSEQKTNQSPWAPNASVTGMDEVGQEERDGKSSEMEGGAGGRRGGNLTSKRCPSRSR